jgi:membrane-bound serine protease (ClpP class)
MPLSTRPISLWRFIALLAATLLVWSNALAAQSDAPADGQAPRPAAPAPVPAYRQADKVVVITLEGGIDAISAMSVRRRVQQAEQAGANALVLEVNSPGGEVGAVLEITNAIKGSSIANTVAWVNPDAYSGGAISALACREIVTSSPASMGDAFPVTMAPGAPGQMPGSLRGLTPAERTKILPVLLADVTDSARRGGYDEYLVQAIIIDGIELWWVRDDRTGAEFAINESEYRLLFGRQPVRGKPLLAGVTGGVSTVPDRPDAATNSESDTPAETPAPPGEDARAFQPASESLEDVAREFDSPERTDLRIELESQRPVLTPDDAGHFTDLGYLCDGTSAIVMREDQLRRFGFSNTVIQSDEQLKEYFGATTLIRIDESWSEKFVRFMTGIGVRFVLIAVMLLALFIEMVSPGLTIPGTIAAACLVLLLAPPALVGMAGWWEIAAIAIGIVLLALEAFVIPGFGIFGVLGIVSLFGGLLGTFIPSGSSLADPSTQADLARGATAIVLAMITAGIGMYFVSKHFERLPILDKLILGAREDEEVLAERAEIELLQAAGRPAQDDLSVGMVGRAATALRPSGQAEINGRMVDVVCDLGLIDPGTPVRVVKIEGWRVVVTEVRAPRADIAGDAEGTA